MVDKVGCAQDYPISISPLSLEVASYELHHAISENPFGACSDGAKRKVRHGK